MFSIKQYFRKLHEIDRKNGACDRIRTYISCLCEMHRFIGDKT